MGPIAIRRELLRQRRRFAATAAVLVCALAIAAHHSGLAMSHGDDGMGTSAVAEMCLGAFAAVGAAIVAVALGALALGRWRPQLLLLRSRVLLAADAPGARARGGPELLLLLCVSRR